MFPQIKQEEQREQNKKLIVQMCAVTFVDWN